MRWSIVSDHKITGEGSVRYCQIIGAGLLGIILAAGCVSKGERIDIKVPLAGGAPEKVVEKNSATIAIRPFEDNRTDRSNLGTRRHMWGGESRFSSLPNGSLGDATAQAFADYLNAKGWNATVVESRGPVGADIILSGSLDDVGVDVASSIGQTTLYARNRMVVFVKNLADESQIRETLASTGTNQVFWFEPDDAQDLLNELYNKNFEKFVKDTKLEGRVLKLR